MPGPSPWLKLPHIFDVLDALFPIWVFPKMEVTPKSSKSLDSKIRVGSHGDDWGSPHAETPIWL